MSDNDQVMAVYFRLVEDPSDDTMLVLADALEEAGNDPLARAYRWCGTLGKYPFIHKKSKRWHTTQWREVLVDTWDWDSDHRDMDQYGIPHRSCLPREVWSQILKLGRRKYGTQDDAFVLVARVLGKCKVEGIYTAAEEFSVYVE